MKQVVGEALEFQVQKIDPHRGTEQKQSDLKNQVQICTENIANLCQMEKQMRRFSEQG